MTTRHKRPPRRGIMIALFTISILLMGAAVLIGRYSTLRQEPLRAFTTPEPTAALTERQAVREPMLMGQPVITPQPTPKPARVLGASTINIVLMGLDSNEEREERNMGYRSDTLAVLVIDVDKPACTVINIPRDTRTRVRRLNSAGATRSTQYNRINAAFQFGGGPDAYGHENAIFSLEELLFDGLESDVNLGYYSSLDMDGIARFADAVDGVPLVLPYDIAGFGKEGEEIILRGEQARKFVRLRHGITGGSDIGRIGRQQLFIKAFAARVQELGGREAVSRLWSTVSEYVHTNLTLEQVLVLGDLLAKLDMDTIEFQTLPGKSKTIDGRSYFVPNREKIRELATALWK